ncbi:prolyl hydroxylase family protein [Maricaulis parjimensis]|uniref:prolyl hydroxylase family protein n=1 Tax=Maricaulis parjimensis TaxID=144023 RepID=UPI00193ADCFE|nr:2OG-Fe(II) oxygenase [Maricaulis parjimensis]
MTVSPNDPNAPAPTALKEWHEGRHDTALERLETAARAGDEVALSLMVQLSGHEPGKAQTRARAMALMDALPDGMMRNRHRAYFQAAGLAGAADWSLALKDRLLQAEGGDWLAHTELGLLALMAGETEAGMTWLETAAKAGSGHAIAALHRIGLDTGTLSPIAREAGTSFARSGHPMAQALIAKAHPLPVAPAPAELPAATDDILSEIAAAITHVPAADERLADAPRIDRWDDVLPGAVCDYLTVSASPLLKPAQIHDPATGQMRQDPYRTSLTAALPEQVMDLVSFAIKTRMAALSGKPVETGEALAVLAYRPGEEYRAHFDFILDVEGEAKADLDARGQRVATSLIRLNSEFEGGETRFTRLDLSWSGGRGSALSFDNVTAEGECAKASLHTGEPVTQGVKVIASLWLRERA